MLCLLCLPSLLPRGVTMSVFEAGVSVKQYFCSLVLDGIV